MKVRISIDPDSWSFRYVLWGYGSICNQVFTDSLWPYCDYEGSIAFGRDFIVLVQCATHGASLPIKPEIFLGCPGKKVQYSFTLHFGRENYSALFHQFGPGCYQCFLAEFKIPTFFINLYNIYKRISIIMNIKLSN